MDLPNESRCDSTSTKRILGVLILDATFLIFSHLLVLCFILKRCYV